MARVVICHGHLLSVAAEHGRCCSLERVGFDRIHVFTRQVEAAFAKHNAFNLSGEYMNPIKPDTL